MKVISQLISIVIVSSISYQAFAGAEVEVNWTNSEQYTDIKDSFAGIQATQEDAFYNIEKVLQKLAKKLPDDYLLKLDVTDLDLAGETHTQNVRIVRNSYPPQIKFSYQLLDNNNQVIKENEESLRDSSFMHSLSLRYKNDAFGFEKQMLDDWFKDSFSEQIVQTN